MDCAPCSTAALRGVVTRTRLVDLVDSIEHVPVVAVTAPAGWGKSQLLATWLEARRWDGPVAVIRLSSALSRRAFWHLFLRSIRDAVAGATSSRLASLALAPDGEVAAGSLMRHIVAELADSRGAIAIVIDDVQHVEGSPVLADIRYLVANLPAECRLILSGRYLPVPVGRLYAEGRLVSIGPEDLAFTPNELIALSVHFDVQLAPADVVSLQVATQGWAAGLRLALIPVAKGYPVPQVVRELRSGRHQVEDYLAEELLGVLPEDLDDFLVRCSVAPELDRNIAAALSGRDDAGVLLAELASRNAFTTPLADRPGWYQIHPLIASAMVSRLQRTRPDELLALHREAARAKYSAGDRASAFDDAVIGQDGPFAGRIASELWLPAFLDGDVSTVTDLIARVPGEVHVESGLTGIRELLDAPRWRDDEWESACVIDSEMSLVTLVASLERARRAGDVAVSQRCADEIGERSRTLDDSALARHLRAHALLSVGVVEYWADERPIAERHLREALVDAQAGGHDYVALGCLAQLVGVLTAQNRVNDALTLADEASALAITRGWERSGWAAELWHALGWISFLRCDLERSERYLVMSEQSVCRNEVLVGTMVPTIRALIAGLRRDRERATALLELALARLGRARDRYVFLPYIVGELARHAVAGGEFERARQLLGEVGPTAPLHLSLALAELYDAQGRGDLAADVLHRGLERGSGYLDERVQALVLLALVVARLGAAAKAVEVMGRALRLATTEWILQPFALFGPDVRPLVAQAARLDGAVRPFAKAVHSALSSTTNRAAAGDGDLTRREAEVLELLDSHATLAEIATRMGVSVNTMKTHVSHIYSKFGTNGRRATLAEATRRGLL